MLKPLSISPAGSEDQQSLAKEVTLVWDPAHFPSDVLLWLTAKHSWGKGNCSICKTAKQLQVAAEDREEAPNGWKREEEKEEKSHTRVGTTCRREKQPLGSPPVSPACWGEFPLLLPLAQLDSVISEASYKQNDSMILTWASSQKARSEPLRCFGGPEMGRALPSGPDLLHPLKSHLHQPCSSSTCSSALQQPLPEEPS